MKAIKANPRLPFITLTALIAGLGFILPSHATAQIFTTIYSFTLGSGVSAPPSSYTTNSDGAAPIAGLILSGNTLYGAAQYGGNFSYGSVFAVNADGSGFTNLHDFIGGSDGAYPLGSFILSGNTLYGTTAGTANQGGTSGNGTVFAINTDGTGFTNLHSFTGGNDGDAPWDELILSSNKLYGTTRNGRG